jgi:threonine synthase
MWKAFDELEAIGLIGPARPRMYAVQSEGCAPIVRAFEQGTEFAEPWTGAVTRAAGIRVPAAIGDHLILQSLRLSGGGAIAVPETEIEAMQAYAANAGAGYLSLESAAALAALPLLRDRALIDSGERVVVFDTGAGFKSESRPIEDQPVVPNDPDAWPAVIARLD